MRSELTSQALRSGLRTGHESKDNRYNECEKLPGRTGYELGIFTSTALVDG